MPQITDAQREEIIDELFRRVGTDRSELDTKKPDWFQQRSWTEAEELEFTDWLTKFFQKKLKLSKKYALSQARTFCLWYGWSIKSETST